MTEPSSPDPGQSHRFCVAPMMDGTDRHCRYFHRRLTRRARLYSEMVTADAVLHGDRDRLLAFDVSEHPVALQLGGSDPARLRAAARIGADHGYDEINLNVGCPSDRVQSGAFGACLMRTPDLVAECAAAMRAAANVPVTVKCRLGVDDQNPEESLFGFVETVAAAGVSFFIVHARKAWLNGLSPKENREIPPLDYEIVARLKAARPELTIILNGGIRTIAAAAAHLARFDGVMLGRAAYGEPYILADVDREIFGEPGPPVTREAAARAMIPYLEALEVGGGRAWPALRHMLGLFHGSPGARLWRRRLSEQGASVGARVVAETLAELARARAPEAA